MPYLNQIRQVFDNKGLFLSEAGMSFTDWDIFARPLKAASSFEIGNILKQ
jgi:hypothetical protein